MPPPAFLSLFATLTVHPAFTTRVTSNESRAACTAALAFLRQVLQTVGPIHADFRAAFAFSGQATSGRDLRHARRAEGPLGGADTGSDGDSGPDGGAGAIQSDIALAGSLWGRKESFWDVFGWAMNCATAWPARWPAWRVWLGFMLDVMEEDWAERELVVKEESDLSDQGSTNSVEETSILLDSLVMAYLAEPAQGGRSSKRRVMRAIFADGSAKSLAEFGEVWKGETRGRKGVEARPVKRRRLSSDEAEFGLWCDGDEEDAGDDEAIDIKEELRENAGKTPAAEDKESRPRMTQLGPYDQSSINTAPDTESNDTFDNGRLRLYGGQDGLVLRRRVLVLVC